LHNTNNSLVTARPQLSQVEIFSAASAIAPAKGRIRPSRFLMRSSAARRAERGPKPGSLESRLISRSISGLTVDAISKILLIRCTLNKLPLKFKEIVALSEFCVLATKGKFEDERLLKRR